MTMKFKIDENLPQEVVLALQHAGYDALSVQEQELGGERDSRVARVCQAEQRVIITLDLDFADIRAYPPHEYAGLIVLRLKRQDKITVLAVFERLLKALVREPLNQKLWIVDEQRIRIRE